MPFGPRAFDGCAFIKSIGITQREPPRQEQLEQAWPKYVKGDQMTKAEFKKFMADVYKVLGADDDDGPPEAEINEQIDDMFRKADKDHDGNLSKNEFTHMFEDYNSD